tara:strand:+ start:237 stop:878 length:642 start_codon:yes stop_codon:yes gene_type:complete
MKKLIVLLSSISCFTASAVELSYNLKGIHNGNNYSVDVRYDTEDNNIVNSPFGGWQQVLTIPDADIVVTYNDLKYTTTGATISASNNAWGKSLKVEAIQAPNQNINQISFQIDAESSNSIMNPLDNDLEDNSAFLGGSFNLYLNDIGVFTAPYEFVDPNNSQFSKVSGSNEICSPVNDVIYDLSLICPDDYSCPMDIKIKITEAKNKLAAMCL